MKGRICVVTGGLGGLGAAAARTLVESEARVVVFARNIGERAPRDPDLLAKAKLVEVDITVAEQVDAAFGQVVDQVGPPTAVVHCAGVAPLTQITDRRSDRFSAQLRQAIDVNVIGTMNVVRGAALVMTPPADGSTSAIILTSSIAAFDGLSGQSAYAASKGAVASMTLPMARELSVLGIRVVTIAPGVFETPMTHEVPSSQKEMLAGMSLTPNRLGHADEYAQLVRHVLENNMLNGEVIRIDGGLRLPHRK